MNKYRKMNRNIGKLTTMTATYVYVMPKRRAIVTNILGIMDVKISDTLRHVQRKNSFLLNFSCLKSQIIIISKAKAKIPKTR